MTPLRQQMASTSVNYLIIAEMMQCIMFNENEIQHMAEIM